MRLRAEPKSLALGKGEENSCQTHQAILDAAMGRFLHYGFKKTTIDEIAQAAGVGKGTVYLYFDSKEDIMLTIVRNIKRNVTAQMRVIAGSPIATQEDKLRRMLTAPVMAVHDACTAALHGVEFVDETIRPSLEACAREENEAQLKMIADVLREGVRRGEFSVPEGDADMAARHLKLALVSFFPPMINSCHGSQSCRVSLEGRVSSMIDFLLAGVRAR